MIARLSGLLLILVALSTPFTVDAAPLSETTAQEIRRAIEKNWNIPIGLEHLEDYVVRLRLHLSPDGVVTQVDALDDDGNPDYRTFVESARRAVLVTQNELGRLPIPADQLSPTIILRWSMKDTCEQFGGC